MVLVINDWLAPTNRLFCIYYSEFFKHKFDKEKTGTLNIWKISNKKV